MKELKHDTAGDLILKAVLERISRRCLDAVGYDGGEMEERLFSENIFSFSDEAEAACNSVDVWSAIRLVNTYETANYGEQQTIFEPVPIANAIAWLYGKFLLSQSARLSRKWDEELTKQDVVVVIREIQSFLNNNVDYRGVDGLVWDYYGTY